MRRVGRAAIPVGLAMALVSAAPRLSSAVTLFPVEDTFVTVHSGLGGSTSNHGPDTTVWLIGSSGFVSVPLIQFDLSAFAGGTAVGDANLSLVVHSTNLGTVGQSINVNLIPVAWDEGTVTWDNFGGLPGTNLTNLTDASIDPNDTLVFVIPEATVQAWIDSPSTNFGVALVSQTSAVLNDVRFFSREGTSPPELSFNLVPEPGTALLLGLGLAGLGRARGRRRHR